jgi:hypothetical protein
MRAPGLKAERGQRLGVDLAAGPQDSKRVGVETGRRTPE